MKQLFLFLYLVLVAVGCSSAPQTSPQTSFIYQSGSDCSLGVDADQYTLKLFGVNDTLLSISGKPISNYTPLKMSDYVNSFSLNSFRAAFVIGEDVALITLTTPAYDSSTKEMTYVVTPVTKLPIQMVGKALGSAVLIIEPAALSHDEK